MIWSQKNYVHESGQGVYKRDISTPRAITPVKMTINPNHQKLVYICQRILGQNIGMTDGMGLPAANKVPLIN